MNTKWSVVSGERPAGRGEERRGGVARGRNNVGTPMPRRGFTLMEVMVVVGIIVILAAITVAVGISVRRKGGDAATRTTLKSLDNAMAIFLKSNPEPQPNQDWFAALQAFPDCSKVIKSLTPHYPDPPAPHVADGVADGYGGLIRYIPSGATRLTMALLPTSWTAKPNGYFWSYGPDGIASTSDDIFSDGTGAQ